MISANLESLSDEELKALLLSEEQLEYEKMNVINELIGRNLVVFDRVEYLQ